MNIISIPKKSGGSRTIYAVSPVERQEFRALLDTIRQPTDQMPSAHGFLPGRGIMTNARPHIGAWAILSLDLTDFFPSVRPEMVRGRVPAPVLEQCFPDGAAQQGLPTSPALANIAAAPLDQAVRKILKKSGITPIPVYTRYADDLTISFHAPVPPEQIREITGKIVDCVRRCGFAVNPQKTRIQYASRGRMEVCGIMVDTGLHVSRDFRRRLRAAKHNAALHPDDRTQARRARGLAEFARLRPPCDAAERAKKNRDAVRLAEASRIAEHYHLRRPVRVTRCIPDQEIGGGAIITTDPVYLYGMSDYTPGWTSCMSVTRSQHDYKRGVAFWQRLRGVSLAILPGTREASVAGVRRPVMEARALVFALRDGRRAYGHIYSGHGHSWDANHPLAVALRAAGYIPAHGCAGALVEGHVEQPCPLPYFDHAAPEVITLAESRKKAYRVRLR